MRTAAQLLQADRSAVTFHERLQLPVRYAALPRGARLVLTLMAAPRDAAEFALGSVALPVDTSDGFLAQGARATAALEQLRAPADRHVRAEPRAPRTRRASRSRSARSPTRR